MKYFTLLALVLMFLISTSCNKNKNKDIEKNYISNFMENFDLPKGTNWVIILPGLGCHGCIEEGEAFMKNNIDRKGVFFILTSIESLKILQKKINIDIGKQTNVYLDDKNSFRIPTNNRIYPCVVLLENDVVKDCQFQSPKNSQAFHSLESRLMVEDN